MQIHGEITSINETDVITETFCKRDFVVTIDQNKPYPQTIKFELHNDRCDIIDAYKVGQEVSVDFELKGRQRTDKNGQLQTFNTLLAWKIQPINK